MKLFRSMFVNSPLIYFKGNHLLSEWQDVGNICETLCNLVWRSKTQLQADSSPDPTKHFFVSSTKFPILFLLDGTWKGRTFRSLHFQSSDCFVIAFLHTIAVKLPEPIRLPVSLNLRASLMQCFKSLSTLWSTISAKAPASSCCNT